MWEGEALRGHSLYNGAAVRFGNTIELVALLRIDLRITALRGDGVAVAILLHLDNYACAIRVGKPLHPCQA